MAHSESKVSASNSQMLDQAIEIILEKLRGCQAVSVDEVIQRFPQIERDLREIYPALVLADQLNSDDAERTTLPGREVSADVDAELLYAAFALQCGVLQLKDFLVAFETWNADRTASFKQLIVERGFIPTEAISLLDGLFDQQRSQAQIACGDTIAFSASAGSASHAHSDSRDMNSESANLKERYRFLRPLDRGGLGVVSVAHDQDLNREVAIKEIREDRVDNNYLRNKFLLEAQVTGGLEHPGIVPIYGFGHSFDGRPYYAMRLIKGNNFRLHIRQFHENISQNHLAYDGPQLRRMLRRFVDVCHAIEYAHSRGILHRDIKPVNIMLGRYGETLVVDWGLAKAVGESLQVDSGYESMESINVEPERPLTPSGSDAGSQTRQGSVVGTPAYASPEQLTGQISLIGVASDVYSLGATLFELLSGHPPVNGSLLEILRTVTSGRTPSPRAIQPNIPQPLNAICLKAMAYDPNDRYLSAQHLRLDIERWLDDAPVEAFPEPWYLRTRRWLRKNPTSTATMAASALIITIGLSSFSAIVSKKNRHLAQLNSQLDAKNIELGETNHRLEEINLQLDRSVRELAEANQRETTAREIAQQQSELALSTLNSVIQDIQAGLKNLPGSSDVRRRLLSTALDRLENVATTVAEKATADRSTMLALLDIGELILRFTAEPNSQRVSLASARISTDDAKSTARISLRTLERAEAIARSLHQQAPRDPQAMRDLIQVMQSVSMIHFRLGDSPRALQMSQQSLDLAQSLIELAPTNADHRRLYAGGLQNHGEFLSRMERPKEAKALFEQEREIYIQLIQAHADSTLYKTKLALATEFLADTHLALVEPQLADAQFAEATATLRELLLTQTAPANTSIALARVLWKHTQCSMNLGEVEKAEKQIAESRELYELAASRDTEDTHLRMFLSNVFELEGQILECRSKLDEAVAKVAESLRIREQLYALDRSDTLRARQVSVSLDRLGLLELARGNASQAQVHFEGALKIDKQLVEEDPSNALKQRDYYLSQIRIAKVLESLGEFDKALAIRNEAISICEKLSLEKPDDIVRKRDWMAALVDGAETCCNVGLFDQAESQSLQALELSHGLLQLRPDSIGYLRDQSIVYECLTVNSIRQAAWDDALKYIEQCIDVRASIVEKTPTDVQAQQDLISARTNAADVLGNLKLFSQAIEQCDTIVSFTSDVLESDPGNVLALETLGLAEMHSAKWYSELEDHNQAVEKIRSSLVAFSLLIAGTTNRFDWLVQWFEAGKLAARLELNAGHAEEAGRVLEQLQTRLEELIKDQQSADWAQAQLESLQELRQTIGS